MAGNKAFKAAKEVRNDEFYTQLSDIENELRHYKEHFKGKTVLCNCDDPYESNFFKYFAMNFNYLGLKKLIATCYVTSPVMYTQLSLFDDMEYEIKAPQDPKKKPYKVEITEVGDENGDGAFDLDDIKQLLKSKKNVCTVLKGDGDFRSEECIELLKEADLVVTNPPFSLFREYIDVLFANNMEFLIIGSINNITYKNVFPLIKNNQLWLGYTSPKEFIQPNKEIKKFGNICWFTNEDYIAEHQHDPNANALWLYFQQVISWVKVVFPKYRKEMKGLPWGIFFNKYGHNSYDSAALEARIVELLEDEEVTSNKGIYEYLLSGNEKSLSLRAFPDKIKRAVYERQNGKCAFCGNSFPIERMQGDHIIAWSNGGTTVIENCQMLCAQCNGTKSNH